LFFERNRSILLSTNVKVDAFRSKISQLVLHMPSCFAPQLRY